MSPASSRFLVGRAQYWIRVARTAPTPAIKEAATRAAITHLNQASWRRHGGH